MEIKKGYRRGSKGGQCSIRQRKKDKSHKVLLTENDWEGGDIWGGGEMRTVAMYGVFVKNKSKTGIHVLLNSLEYCSYK